MPLTKLPTLKTGKFPLAGVVVKLKFWGQIGMHSRDQNNQEPDLNI